MSISLNVTDPSGVIAHVKAGENLSVKFDFKRIDSVGAIKKKVLVIP